MRGLGSGRVPRAVDPARNVSGARALHATRAVYVPDFYAVLELPHDASKAQIKDQFYRLSKKYHPDVSKTEEGKQKFQQVSEAYATLGNERKRREYDRQFVPRRAAPSGAHAAGYEAPDNLRRRATADYAREYRQRMQQRDAQRGMAPPPPPPSNATNLFAKMAERETRRETARANSVYSTRGAYRGNPDTFRAYSEKRWSAEEKEAEMLSPFLRFLQVAGIVGAAAWLSTKLL